MCVGLCSVLDMGITRLVDMLVEPNGTWLADDPLGNPLLTTTSKVLF